MAWLSPNVVAHRTTHQVGGSDEIDVTNLSGLLADPQNPLPHAATHEVGGADEINVTGLSGILADAQPPALHAVDHEVGGADEVSIAGLAGESVEMAAHRGVESQPIHGSTVVATAEKLVHRDAAGRARIANPAVDADIDNQGSRNTAIATHAAIADAHHNRSHDHSAAGDGSPIAEAGVPNHMSKNKLAWTANRLLLGAGAAANPTEHEPVSAATAERIVIRDAASRAQVANPAVDADIDTKGARDTAIGTHAALTTGVHGVTKAYFGESSVQGLDLSAHQTRHQWLGADELRLGLNVISRAVPSMVFFESLDRYTQAVSGTGSIAGTVFSLLLGTGTTNGSTVRVNTARGWLTAIGKPTYFDLIFLQITAVIVRCHLSIAAPSLDTSQHIGFKLVNADLYASVGDGINGTQTLMRTLAAAGGNRITIVPITGGFEFYYGATLDATITTNLPASTSGGFTCQIENTAAANKQIQVYSFGNAIN